MSFFNAVKNYSDIHRKTSDMIKAADRYQVFNHSYLSCVYIHRKSSENKIKLDNISSNKNVFYRALYFIKCAYYTSELDRFSKKLEGSINKKIETIEKTANENNKNKTPLKEKVLVDKVCYKPLFVHKPSTLQQNANRTLHYKRCTIV